MATPTEGVRFGVYEETSELEKSKHWRALLEEREGFYDLLVYYKDYYDELDGSPVAQDIIDDLNYTFPDDSTR